jgi:hypothetical protein
VKCVHAGFSPNSKLYWTALVLLLNHLITMFILTWPKTRSIFPGQHWQYRTSPNKTTSTVKNTYKLKVYNRFILWKMPPRYVYLIAKPKYHDSGSTTWPHHTSSSNASECWSNRIMRLFIYIWLEKTQIQLCKEFVLYTWWKDTQLIQLSHKTI